MTIEQLKSSLPDYAKDIRLNLSTVLSESGAPGLTRAQIMATALAAAYATKSQLMIDAVVAEAAEDLSESVLQAVKAAVVIMAMNNVYYRFVHYSNDAELKQLPAKLRMNVMAKPGVEAVDFEMYSLAVSAINGCGLCMESHATTLQKHGLLKQGVQSVIRIAAVVNAAAQALALTHA